MTSRDYYDSDYALFCEWCEGHGKEPLASEYLPTCGIVVSEDEEPVAMLFAYFDNSTPVCFAERAITRPGMSAERAACAVCFAVERAKEYALDSGFDLMLARIPKGMVRFATRRSGFEVEEQEVVNLCFHLIRKEELCLG